MALPVPKVLDFVEDDEAVGARVVRMRFQEQGEEMVKREIRVCGRIDRCEEDGGEGATVDEFTDKLVEHGCFADATGAEENDGPLHGRLDEAGEGGKIVAAGQPVGRTGEIWRRLPPGVVRPEAGGNVVVGDGEHGVEGLYQGIDLKLDGPKKEGLFRPLSALVGGRRGQPIGVMGS